jgi:hypothetical protein
MSAKLISRFFWFVLAGTVLLVVYETVIRHLQGYDVLSLLYTREWWFELSKAFSLVLIISFGLMIILGDWAWWLSVSVLIAVFVDLIVVRRIESVVALNSAVESAWYYIYVLLFIRILSELLTGHSNKIPRWAWFVGSAFLGFDLLVRLMIYFGILPHYNIGIF